MVSAILKFEHRYPSRRTLRRVIRMIERLSDAEAEALRDLLVCNGLIHDANQGGGMIRQHLKAWVNSHAKLPLNEFEKLVIRLECLAGE